MSIDTDFSVPNETVICWQFQLNQKSTTDFSNLFWILSPEEQLQAAKYRNQEDCLRSKLSHIITRLILSKVLNQHPAKIKFVKEKLGKPQILDSKYQFNLSHSSEIILIAVSNSFRIGVDVQKKITIPEYQSLIRYYFHPNEINELFTLSNIELESAFFSCWTRKEAVSKAIGMGLKLPLNQYCVSCLGNSTPKILVLPKDSCEDSWTLHDIEMPLGYFAAVAANRAPIKVVNRIFSLSILHHWENLLSDY